MLKKLMLTTAIGALMIGGAMAQTTAPSSSPAPAASAQSGATVTQQKPGQYLASKFRGTDVVGADNQKIGDVTDILFDKSGKIDAYIVSVGGFLGIGAKDVALEPSKFQVVAAEGNTSYERLKLSMSKEQLQQMASFEPYSPAPAPRQTTGAGGMGGTSRPATGSGN
jgi:hypothetical protein